jgi:hypothetical protein
LANVASSAVLPQRVATESSHPNHGMNFLTPSVSGASFRLFTRLSAPPVFRFRSYARLTALQPVQGFILAIIPVLVMVAIMEILFNQIDLLRWHKTTFGAFQNNMFLASETVQMDVVMHGRFGLGLAVVAVYTMFIGAQLMTPKKDRIEVDEMTTGTEESIDSRSWQPGKGACSQLHAPHARLASLWTLQANSTRVCTLLGSSLL